MTPITPRPISADEAAVVKAALSVAPARGAPTVPPSSIDRLKVIAICQCGCRGVEFECPPGESEQLADGVGLLKSGGRVDIIVWGRSGSVAALEIVNYDVTVEFPIRVVSWEEAGRAS